jgi:hypothetical protein
MKPYLHETERDLLIAALAQDGREAPAYTRFMSKVDFAGTVDGGHFRMLPMVYSNLARAGVAAAQLSRVRGVYRYSWCKAQQLAQRAEEAVSALQAQDVPVLVAKGFVLAKRYYASPAQRPMSDIDVAVPIAQVREAAAALGRIGYVAAKDLNALPDRAFKDVLALRHSMAMTRGSEEIDLHWYVMKQCRRQDANRRFWSNAQPFAVCDRLSALQLRPEDMLLHVVIHGLQSNAMPPIRWIADAATIVRAEGRTLDWESAFDTAAAFDLEGHFRAGIEFLRTLDIVELPRWTRPVRMTLTERVERWAHGKSKGTQFAADIVRLATSDGRGHIPRLAARWTARRLGVR